jgi:excisionase family DNA binding protein
MSILDVVLEEEKRKALRDEQAREERQRFLAQLPLLEAQIEEEKRKAQDEEKHRQERAGVLQQLPLLLRIEQAAHELQLSRRRIYQLVSDGDLELVKIGKSSRITRASLLRLARAREE